MTRPWEADIDPSLARAIWAGDGREGALILEERATDGDGREVSIGVYLVRGYGVPTLFVADCPEVGARVSDPSLDAALDAVRRLVDANRRPENWTHWVLVCSEIYYHDGRLEETGGFETGMNVWAKDVATMGSGEDRVWRYPGHRASEVRRGSPFDEGSAHWGMYLVPAEDPSVEILLDRVRDLQAQLKEALQALKEVKNAETKPPTE